MFLYILFTKSNFLIFQKFLNIEEKIDVFPVNSKKNMVVNDKNQFNKETINSSNINCLVEPGIQFEQHYIVKDVSIVFKYFHSKLFCLTEKLQIQYKSYKIFKKMR